MAAAVLGRAAKDVGGLTVVGVEKMVAERTQVGELKAEGVAIAAGVHGERRDGETAPTGR